MAVTCSRSCPSSLLMVGRAARSIRFCSCVRCSDRGPPAAFDVALQDVTKTIATSQANSGHVCESYQADRDGCFGGQDLTWGSAAFVVSLTAGVLGLQPDASSNALAWAINLLEPYTVTNLCFGSNVVALGSARRADASAGARLTVTTNNPFTMTVSSAGLTCTQSLPAGTTTLECEAYR